MKRITVISGHYGSGKSEFSINLAFSKQCDAFVDLDVVNPYFRSRELEKMFHQKGIRLVGSSLKDALGSDLPFLAPDIYAPFSNPHLQVIVDLGGDPVGAKLMRQFSNIIDLDSLEFLICVNLYREKTQNKDQIITMIRSIEASSGYQATGLINTTHQLKDTMHDDILQAQKILLEVAKQLHIPIKYTAIPHFLLPTSIHYLGEIVAINMYLRPTWL